MRYRNIKTGLYLVTDCKVESPYFEPIVEDKLKAEPKAEVKEEKPKTTKRAKK